MLALVIAGTVIWIFAGRTPAHTATQRTEKKPAPVKPAVAATHRKSSSAVRPSRPQRPVRSRSYTAEEVRDLLANHPPRLTSPTDTIQAHGRTLILHYSLDTTLTVLGRTLLRRYRPLYGALVALDPVSGRISALSSYTHDSVPSLGSALYCRALFPAASVFKTVTAAAALDRGLLTADSQLKLAGARHTLYKTQLQRELRSFSEISLTDAFAYSVNPVFGRIGAYTLGAESLRDYARRFGFGIPVPFELNNEPSVAVIGDSLFELAEAASGFNQRTTISPLLGALIAASVSNRGIMPQPSLIDSITDMATGTLLYRTQPRLWRIPFKPATATQLEKCMRAAARYGTARKSFRTIRNSYQFNTVSYGGKTGSLNKDSIGRVDWFVGFASQDDNAFAQLAVGIVTVHGAFWTVHSSYIASELIRRKIRMEQIAAKQPADRDVDAMPESAEVAAINDSLEE